MRTGFLVAAALSISCSQPQIRLESEAGEELAAAVVVRHANFAWDGTGEPLLDLAVVPLDRDKATAAYRELPWGADCLVFFDGELIGTADVRHLGLGNLLVSPTPSCSGTEAVAEWIQRIEPICLLRGLNWTVSALGL